MAHIPVSANLARQALKPVMPLNPTNQLEVSTAEDSIVEVALGERRMSQLPTGIAFQPNVKGRLSPQL